MSIPLVTITLVRTTSFSIYEASKRFFGHLLHHPLYKSPIQTQREQLDKPILTTSPPYHGFFGTNASVAFLAGATSGSFITLLSCPFEFTKMATQIELLLRRTRLAGDPSVSYEPKTPMQMAKDIYFGRGFLGLYSGFGYHLGMTNWDSLLGANEGRTGCDGDGDLFWVL
jgi:solute carrier family 25 carnitine/acylcarnitine transporter 20/29